MNTLGTGRLSASRSKDERVERERRFFLREIPPGLNLTDEHAQITDNYITGTRLRLRRRRWVATNEWTLKLTQKHARENSGQPPDFSRTLITSIFLNEQEYETLSVFEGNELRKNRYPFAHENYIYSVDVFLGQLRGLILAEIEFDTDEAMEVFMMATFAAAEVTHNPVFTGASLAHLTAHDLRHQLNK